MDNALCNYLLAVAAFAGIEGVEYVHGYRPNGFHGDIRPAISLPSMRDFVKLIAKAVDMSVTSHNGIFNEPIYELAENYRSDNLGHDIVIY